MTGILTVVCASAGSAQVVTGTLPPPRPIVTNPIGPPPGSQGLRLNLSVFEAYDRNNSQQLAGTNSTTGTTNSTPVYRRTGFRTGGDASLGYNFNKRGQQASFGAAGHATARVYSGIREPIYSASGGLHGSRPIGRSTNAHVTSTFSYAPYYSFGSFPTFGGIDPTDLAASVDPDINLAILPSQTYRYGVTGGLSRQLSLRTSLAVFYDLQYSDFGGNQPTFVNQHGRINLSRQISQGLGLHVGYGYGVGSNGQGDRYETHDIDLGVNFNRALSVSRRTTLSFATGSSIVGNPSDGSQQSFGRRFHVTGNANLNHQIGRTWSAGVGYHRRLHFVDGFSAPTLSDSVIARMGGQLSRNSNLGIVASLQSGAFATGSDARHSAYHGSATYRTLLLRWLTGYVQYGYYRHQFPNAQSLPFGFPPQLSRNSIRAGASVAFQLIG